MSDQSFRFQLNNYIQGIYRYNAVRYTQQQTGNVWKVKCYIKDELFGEATFPTVAGAKENAAEQALMAHRAQSL